jgi:tRNA dimethylallyltransferase
MTNETQPLICLAGPTASGKSAISLALAEHLPIEIINMDSATIYRGMDIGTAKPGATEQALVPHHLIDILDPSQSYSAAQFRQDALACVSAIRARGNLPLLVGGTMLYYKVLSEGIDDLPPANEQIRQDIQTQAQALGWPALHAELTKVDPPTAARLAPNDSQRIARALEVFRTSGKPMSSLLGQRIAAPQPTVLISLEPSERQTLYDRIDERFDQMLDAGLLDECERLYRRGDLHTGLPSMRCVGYRQLWDHIAGQCSLEQARERAIIATRHLAKRQLTWLRSMPARHCVDCLCAQASTKVLALVQAAIDDFPRSPQSVEHPSHKPR